MRGGRKEAPPASPEAGGFVFWDGVAWAAVAVAAAARLVFFRALPVADHGNASYTIPAYGLATMGVYSELHRLPGAPFFFALCYALAGRHDAALTAAQHLLGLATLGLLVSFSRRAWGRRAGAVAAALGAAQLWFPFQECYLLSESLAQFLLAAALWSVQRLRERRPGAAAPWMAAGLVAASAGLTRGELALVGPLSALALLGSAAGRTRRGPALFLAGWAALTGGWIARNEARFGFAGLTPDVPAIFLQTALPLVRYDLPTHAEGKARLREAAAELPQLGAEVAAEQLLERKDGRTYLEASRELGAVALEAIAMRPLAYAPLFARALVDVILPYAWIDDGAIGNGIPALETSKDAPPPAFWTLLRLDQWVGWAIFLLALSAATSWRRATARARWAAGLPACLFAALALAMASSASTAREQAELQLLLIPVAAFAVERRLGGRA